ncbi:MAG: 4Fe-4S dicluster domain-containing protein [Planctomycetota bacterium]
MSDSDTIAVRRPQRWDEPMDPNMTDADVQWLLQQRPFRDLDPAAFPRTMPLTGVLRHDCRLHRFEPGSVIVREGDYGNSAYLVLRGRVELLTHSPPPEQLGRDVVTPLSWLGALGRFLRPSGVREARPADRVSGMGDWRSNATESDDHTPVLFLQDFEGLVRAGSSVALGPGELFGEVAAMYRSPRSATVIAGESSAALEIRWQGLKALRRDKDFAIAMETHYRQTWLSMHLREVPLFRYLPEANLRRVVDAVAMRSFGRMQWNTDYAKTRRRPPADQIADEPVVVGEGHHVTDLILVRSGFGRICQQYGTGKRTTAYLGKGHLFGLEEISQYVIGGAATPVPLQHSLHAVGYLDTLHIPVECFANDILPHVRRSELPASAAQAIMSTSVSTARERRSGRRRRDHPPESHDATTGTANDSDDDDDDGVVIVPPASATWNDLPSPTGATFEPTGLLEFIVQHRFNNGQQAMVIDLHRCTRCDDCVKACASVHDGNPRFARIGPSHERLQVVEACMQCSDPVCMIGCPTGAIHRNEDTGVVSVSEPICIGCGVCANACPYSAIEMVEIRSADGRRYTDESGDKPIIKATKCDMCAGLPSGPACQAACPHDALVRISLDESPPLDEWLRRRA